MNSLTRICPQRTFNYLKNIKVRNMSVETQAEALPQYETLKVTSPAPFVCHVELNRPEKRNAINDKMWKEIGKCFDELGENENCRSIVLSGAGKLFCSGIELQDLAEWGPKLADLDDVARKCKFLRSKIKEYQNSLSALERCPKPVITAVHGGCIGGAVDVIVAADIRFCSKDAWFQVKEVEVGLAADVGTLQRLPKVLGSESLVRDLCLTARKMDSAEALASGFVSKVLDSKESTVDEAIKVATLIAKRSPVAVQGTKQALIYARDHSVQEGLDQIANWNQTMLQSDDLMKSVMAMMTKEDVPFSKL